ncbi:MAG: secretin N-terminal domain-containing protein [Planctomycetota bacterium]|nr:secretin N-terminal domain-containing protein [Planctomycetota bacterium]
MSKPTGRPRNNRTEITRLLLAAGLLHTAAASTALAQGGSPVKSPAPAEAAPVEDDAATEARVRVDENNLVDLAVNDEDLGNVLEMLSIQSQKNIIASKSVSARVTANLFRVSFYEALDAILGVNGFGYVEQGNFIMVYTLDELRVLESQSRRRVSKVINLNYLSATDAAEFVKPLLSVAVAGQEAGQMKTNGKLANFPSIGDTPLGADEFASTSTIVVFDYEENVSEIEALLQQLDIRPSQVLVEATILQTSLNEANALGVDFSLVADANLADFVSQGGPLGVVNGLISGRATSGGSSPLPADGSATGVTSTVGGTAGAGGLKVGIVSDDVAVFLRVLDEVTDTTILSNPKVLALNRQASRVLVGRKVGYLSTTSTDTATTQTVQFLDTGTQLYFRPIVSSDGMIRMELKPQVSEAVIREQRDATGAAVTIPDEITNELTTNVMVRDGQTVVLGGLFRESTQSSRSQVPLLGDIPIIGYAFRGQEDEVQRSEIIFTVTPHIITDAAIDAQASRFRDQADRVRAGAREGTLPFSRERLTSILNVKAENAAVAGDTDRAMWYLSRSLAMNSNQPEAIGLRERLAGKKMNWPNRSVLDRIIDGETDHIISKSADAGSTAVIDSVLASDLPPATPEATFTLSTTDTPDGMYTTAGTQQTSANTSSANTAAADAPADNAFFVYTQPPTATSFGAVGMFNQFVSIRFSRHAAQLRETWRTTNVSEEVPASIPEIETMPGGFNK